ARLQPAASRRRLHEGQLWEDQFRRHHHAWHEQFRADLAHADRLGLSRRRLTRWVKPVRPGDTIRPTGIVKSKQVTAKSRWVLIDVMVRNQHDEKVANGEDM